MLETLQLAKRLPDLARFAMDDRKLRRLYEKYRNFTMITPDDYVENLRLAAGVKHIRGSIVECGTWRGGMIAGIADVLGPNRHYLLFDSFEGLPQAKEVDGKAALAWQANKTASGYYNNCTASEEEARSAMSLSAAKTYSIVKGWFDQTLPKASFSEPIALLRLDADWYESTKCVLNNVAPRVAQGGIIIVDDYHTWDGCTLAINEFAASRKWRIRQSRRGICFIMA
jgi:O-methyltransferase